MTTLPLGVIIIGAGTGGLCLAHGLRREGIQVQVFERDRTRADGLQGYRVGIDPHGMQALKACLPASLYDTFIATCARTPTCLNYLTENLREVLSLDWSGSTDDAIGKSVSRMTLRQVLLTGLEDCVQFDKTFVRYEQHANGTATAWFSDGTSATANLLVGADGARSPVRRQFLPHARTEDTGIVSIGAKVPLTDETRKFLTPNMARGISLVMAPKGFGAIVHVMDLDWKKRLADAHAHVGTSDDALLAQWPGLLYDNTSDYVMWGVWGARRNWPADPMTLRGSALVALSAEVTHGWHPNMRALIRLADPTTAFGVNVRTSVPVEPWTTTNVTVLGDAIHLMTPGRGVGANTALRDAQLLAERLGAVAHQGMSLHEAVAGYESQMREYGFHAVAESRKRFDERYAMHRPIVGRFALGAMRTSMRVVNAVPPLKQRMIDAQSRFRGATADTSSTSTA
ncbi:FAD-dependent monooxygenase [Pararobbsia alpina]|uniref:FAD-dependent oxidoreductase n=1 Tax=Pararobbsia alpina TaxID=621374 RepID=UPI0039A6FE4A